jgi:hypothetical protein
LPKQFIFNVLKLNYQKLHICGLNGIFSFLRIKKKKKNNSHCTIDFLACPCELEVYPIWMGRAHSDVVKDGNDEHY